MEIGMFHRASLKPTKDSPKSWNTRILICAIAVIIGVIVAIELHIRGLISHAVLLR